jgi:radical SAM protein with 4Fe4S-binding SPASM domain
MDFMSPKVPAKNMTRKTFADIIAWLSKSPEKAPVHLMGGEPTLNPDFEWCVEHLLARDFQMNIFSNLATPKAAEYAEKLADLPIHWVVNINPPETWNEMQRERILSALKALGQKANITFNIMPDADNNDWAIKLIKEYNLNRGIKVGFVLPTATGSNYHLSDNEYDIVAAKVVELAKEAEKDGIRLEFECGVPTCAFTDEQLGTLWDCGSTFDSSCCSRLDVNPDGYFIYCLPLATKCAVHFSEYENYEEVKNMFERKFQPFRMLGRTENCHHCNLMRPDVCNGGCLAKMLLNAKNV